MTDTIRDQLRRAWLEALRSGEFDQGEGVLAYIGPKGTSYCCLGVACEVAIKHGVEIKKTVDDAGCILYNDYPSCLPNDIAALLGINYDDQDELMELNDHEDYDFYQIADHLERLWEMTDD